jgi:hypothetical protein
VVQFVAKVRTKSCATTPISAVPVLHEQNAGGSETTSDGRCKDTRIYYHLCGRFCKERGCIVRERRIASVLPKRLLGFYSKLWHVT